MVAGKFGHLAALLMKAHPAPALLDIKVFDLHSGGRSDAGEGVAHQSDQGAISKPKQGSSVDRGQQLTHLLGREHGGFAFLDAVLRSSDGMSWVALHDVPCHQPIEEHTDRGEVLFDGGLRMGAAELLDIRRNAHRRHPGQISEAFLLTPGGESLDGFKVGAAGVRVADVDGEKLPRSADRDRRGCERCAEVFRVQRRKRSRSQAEPHEEER